MQNGLITVQLSSENVDRIMTNSIKMDDYKITVDLENQKVFDNFGFEETFDFDQFRKDSILEGLDDIGITLQFDQEIEKFERNTLK
jgi:3-isopropylmalate dehydratase small subunit